MRDLATQIAVIALSVVGAAAFAQPQTAARQDSKAVGQVVVTGTVISYEVAKSIEVNASGVAHKYDLNDSDTTYSISPEVATGRTVTVTETTGAEGRKSISIAISAPKS